MSNRLLIAIAAAALSSACASAPAPKAATPNPGVPAAVGKPAIATVANMAATSSWRAEERLMPEQPILGLVNITGAAASPAGVAVTCNPSKGEMMFHLGLQPGDRAGQSAGFRILLAGAPEAVDGKYVAVPGTANSEFRFPIDNVRLRTIAQLDKVVFENDKGEAQWALVRDPAAPVSAKYIGSLKNLSEQAARFFYFCNPK